MNSRKPGTGPATGPASGATDSTAAVVELLRDWITIWQSEFTGLVLDREMQDGLLRVIDGWASQNQAMLRMMAAMLKGGGDGGSASAAGPDAAARATAAAAAPDGRDALIRDLLERVAELERRIGEPPPSPP